MKGVSTTLRQADERTKLVVDCAKLLKRLEQLDSETSSCVDVYRAPYGAESFSSDAVQARFEQARKREAAEARMLIGMDHLPLSSLRVSPGRSQYPNISTQHLRRAVLAADFEAHVWRERAFEQAGDMEFAKERLKRLRNFDLSEAMNHYSSADGEHSYIAYVSSDRNAVFEKMEADVRALQKDRDAHRDRANDLKQKLDTLRSLEENRDSAFDKMEMELRSLRAIERDRDVHRDVATDLKEKMDALRSVMEKRIGQTQVEGLRLSERVASREATISGLELKIREAHLSADTSMAELVRKKAEWASMQAKHDAAMETMRRRCNLLEQDLQDTLADRDAKFEASRQAHAKMRVLAAKNEHLEVALQTASFKQAELTMEMDTHLKRAKQVSETCNLSDASTTCGSTLHSPPASPVLRAPETARPKAASPKIMKSSIIESSEIGLPRTGMPVL